MCRIRVIDANALMTEGLDERIIELDRRNMRGILENASAPFPEEKRRKTFGNNPTVIAALDENQELVGYLEFCPGWDSPNDVYLSSLQIAITHRNGMLLADLLAAGLRVLRTVPFKRLVSHVHKNNHAAIRLYRKLGFAFSENPKSNKTFAVTAGREILDNPRLAAIVHTRRRSA